MNVQPFGVSQLTLPVSVTATASTAAKLPQSGSCIRLVNAGANICFVAVQLTAALAVATLPNSTATVTSTPVLPGSDIILSLPSDAQYYISAICNTGLTTTLYAEVGEGQ